MDEIIWFHMHTNYSNTIWIAIQEGKGRKGVGKIFINDMEQAMEVEEKNITQLDRELRRKERERI